MSSNVRYLRGDALCIRTIDGVICNERGSKHRHGRCPRDQSRTYKPASSNPNRLSFSINAAQAELLNEILVTLVENKRLTKYKDSEELDELAEVVRRVSVRATMRAEKAAASQPDVAELAR